MATQDETPELPDGSSGNQTRNYRRDGNAVECYHRYVAREDQAYGSLGEPLRRAWKALSGHRGLRLAAGPTT